MTLLETFIRESISINGGSLSGAMDASDLDRDDRTHHPYNWAAESFGNARTTRDWEQVPETTEDQVNKKKAKKFDLESELKKYIDATIVYKKTGPKYKDI